ncbi:hypothetical protein Lal_00034066 [Lupinus albus]|uniref:Uncharacterized protein n=1 Tax=Lupinus albus TaxID=3870 RepID=A0A6A4QTE4_LUPAL|nr:hypothetical protein Lalb_Chr03g0029811 [Lupinus albus]KAF1896368.1 hypothetical protein Lal_00034066 [Lupinus albus]
MSKPNPQIPDETQNPNPQCEEAGEERAPSTTHLDSQSPKTSTLPDQDPRIDNLPDSDAANPNPNQHTKDEDTIMKDPTQAQNAEDPEPEAPAISSAVLSTVARRVAKRLKMGPKRIITRERQFRKKLKVLDETLKPIPFAPSKTLDFESHKTLLERLGLWDFVHIKFDTAIRVDLVLQLIASYGLSMGCSYVNGCRIYVSRDDLARALNLPEKFPVKKTPVPAAAVESVELVESITFIEELVFNWMLLHEDIHVMTDDVLAYLKVIKEGHFEKVDWADLIWNMLEKELKEEKLVNCYYASHLQQLIKIQHGELLEEAPKVEKEEEADVKAEGEEVGVKDEEEDDVGEELDGSSDVKMGGIDESQVHELEENKVELSLGQDNVVRVEVEKEQGQVGGDQTMDFEPAKEKGHGMGILDLKNNVGEPFLRPCHTGDVKVMECGEMNDAEGEEEQEQEGEEQEGEEDAEDQQEGGFHLSHKCIPMEGMPSGTGSLIQAMDGGQLTFGSGIDLRDNHVGDFLSSRDDDQLIARSSLFDNGHKRDIGKDNHNPRHSLNGSNKRLRSDSPWSSKPVDMELCLDSMRHWTGKARMLYAAKEQACIESTNYQQVLLNELQRRDTMIDHLHKVKIDDSHKIYQLEKELYMMTSLVEGYKKALKEAQKTFAEYRAHCSQSDDPLYKDVPGSGGLVLSVEEFEKERLMKGEEERMKMRDYEKKFREIEGVWFTKLEDHVSTVQSMGNRLLVIGDQVKHLNEVVAKCKVADSPSCAPTSEAQTVE